nr:hypothetical protein [Candidatus Sigynarchaeota archaeon]
MTESSTADPSPGNRQHSHFVAGGIVMPCLPTGTTMRGWTIRDVAHGLHHENHARGAERTAPRRRP